MKGICGLSALTPALTWRGVARDILGMSEGWRILVATTTSTRNGGAPGGRVR
jgi:hypothetical protein